MDERQHIVISGGVGVGKSTAILALVRSFSLPAGGFVTTRRMDENGEISVYINPFGVAPVYTDETRVGRVVEGRTVAIPRTFDELGARWVTPVAGQLLVMDELGIMENGATHFCKKVLGAFSNPEGVHILAAVKYKSTPFLDAVRAQKNAAVFHLTEDNRDEVCAAMRGIMRRWTE